MAEGLKLVIGGDVKEAEQALKTFTSGLDKTGAAVDSFGNNVAKTFGRLPLGDLDKFNKSFLTLKNNINAVRFNPINPQFASSLGSANTQLQKFPNNSNAATQALINFGRVAQDAPFGILGIANNLNPLLESFQRLRQQSGSAGGALKALVGSLSGAGGIGLALSVVSSLLIVFGKNLFGAGEQADKSKEKLDSLSDSIKQVTTNVGALTNALSFQNQLGAINVKIRSGGKGGELQDLKEQSVAQQQLVVDLGNQLLKAEKNLNDARLANIEQNSDESKKIEEDALKAFQDVQEREIEARQKGTIIFRQIALQKITDALEAAKKEEEERKKSLDALKKYIDDAKRLASELEKIGFIQPQFSFFDSQEKQLQKARKVFADFASRNLKIDPKFFKIEPTISEPTSKDFIPVLNAIEEGLQKGIIEKGPIDIKPDFSITTDFSRNAEVLRDFTKSFRDIGKSLPAIDLSAAAGFNENILVDQLRKFFGVGQDVTKEELQKLADEFKKGVDNINNTIKGLAIGGLTSIGEAIGTALAGGDLKNIFSGFVNVLADGLSAIGKQMIALSPVIASLKAALKSLNPAILLPAGVALVAIGSALRSTVGKGVTGFAQGGLVFGPTMGLVGEGIGTSRSNPEVIAPLDQLKGMLADMGGGVQHVIVTGRLRGRDQILQNARTTRSQRRLGVR